MGTRLMQNLMLMQSQMPTVLVKLTVKLTGKPTVRLTASTEEWTKTSGEGRSRLGLAHVSFLRRESSSADFRRACRSRNTYAELHGCYPGRLLSARNVVPCEASTFVAGVGRAHSCLIYVMSAFFTATNGKESCTVFVEMYSYGD